MGIRAFRTGRRPYKVSETHNSIRRELLRVARQLSDEVGTLRRNEGSGADTGPLGPRGRYGEWAASSVERSRDFTLVPWRPVMERHIGKNMSGIMRDGRVSWTFGRQRSGPNIS